MVHPCLDDPDEGCWHEPHGYVWCEPCGDHHRPPVCAIDQDGHALAPCGCRWDVVDPPGSHLGPYVNHHRPGCVYAEGNDEARENGKRLLTILLDAITPSPTVPGPS